MSHPPSKASYPSSSKGSGSRLRERVSAPPPTKPKSATIQLEDLVERLTEPQAKAVLSVVEASIRSQEERKNMPERTLTKAEALTEITRDADIKKRLMNQDKDTVKTFEDLRAKVKLEELDKFDDEFDTWVKTP